MVHQQIPLEGIQLCFGASSERAVLEPISYPDCAELAPQLAKLVPWSTYQFTSDTLVHSLAAEQPNAPRFLIRAGDKKIGIVGVQLNWLRGPYLQFLGILPPHQGRGLGAAVLHWLESEARRMGDRNVWVCVSSFNVRAISFYERHGFRRAALLEGLIQEEHNELLLRKRIA